MSTFFFIRAHAIRSRTASMLHYDCWSASHVKPIIAPCRGPVGTHWSTSRLVASAM